MKVDGIHLIIDGFAPEEICLNEKLIYKFLSEFPEKINMEKLTEPVVIRGTPDNDGYTGFVIINTSHISIHTFVPSNFITIDIFSCKKFDAEKAKEFITEVFKIKHPKTTLLERKEWTEELEKE